MEQSPNLSGKDPADWLQEGAAGDDELYQLLLLKEQVGDSIVDSKISSLEAREQFAKINGLIMSRRIKLGLDPPEVQQ